VSEAVINALMAAGASRDASELATLSLSRAAKRIKGKVERRKSMPADTEIHAELLGSGPFHELSKESRLEIAVAAVYLLPEMFGAPFTITPEWLSSEDTYERLRQLPAETMLGLRRFVIADIESNKGLSWSPIDQSTGYTYRVTKRGQPPRFGDFDFGCALYAAFFDATGTNPGRTWDAIKNVPTGRFHDVVSAAFSEFDFGRNGYGLDRLIREVIPWMAPDGEPFESELEHARRRWLDE